MKAETLEKFSQLLVSNGTIDAIEMLRKEFESSEDYHRLFEVLKLRCRHKHGLPLLFSAETAADGTDPQEQSQQLEACLLAACREVGTLLFRANRPEEGWVFLQPVGDAQLVKRLLTEIEVTEDNRDVMVDLGLGQGIAPAWAFEIMINANGTCDAISAFEMQHREDNSLPGELETMAETLLDFFYNEALESVTKDVSQRTNESNSSATLGELLDQHAWLVTETDPHVDTTHLNSIVAIGRKTRTEKHFRMALELCRYGQRLSDDLVYASDPPFQSPFNDHAHYFSALLGENVEAADDHFADKIEHCNQPGQSGYQTIVVEEIVAWLTRQGRREEALEMHIELLTGAETWGVAPANIEIADTPALKKRLMEHFKATNDLLGYAVCQMQLQQK